MKIADFKERLQTIATAHPDRVALEDTDRCVRYADLLDEVARWDNALAQCGALRVACLLPNGVSWAALDLALLLSERVAVPIPDFFSADQQAYLLKTSGVDTLVSVPGVHPCATINQQLVNGLQIGTIPSASTSLAPSGTAKITFTSGSTGTPKGVCHSAETLLTTANALVEILQPLGINRHLCVLPMALLLENVAGLYASLINGSTVNLPALETVGLTGSSQLDISLFMQAQQRYQPNSVVLVPQLLLALTAAAELGMALPDAYRFIAVGGAKVAPSLIARARHIGLPVYEGYGLTECGSVITLNRPEADLAGSVGQPLPHVDLIVSDGEVVVRTPSMLGYLGAGDYNANQGFPTGDLGSLDADNFLSLSGRANNLIITSFGRNVSPEWVESELQAELQIGIAAVFGNDRPTNVALIAARMNADTSSVEQAVARCNSRLPDYASIGEWHLVDMDDLRRNDCLTANGRIRRDIIERCYADLLAPSSDPGQPGVLQQASPGRPFLSGRL